MPRDRTYTYQAFLEREDRSFVSIEELWQELRALDEEAHDEMRALIERLTPASREEFLRYFRDRLYDINEKVSELRAELGVGPSGEPN